MKQLYVIDAFSPFVDPDSCPYNWSRAPLYDFDNLDEYSPRIIERFELFIKKISKLGYNAVSIDDLAHMVFLDIYDKDLKSKLTKYKRLYAQLFKIAQTNNIKVFVNFDLMYFNDAINAYTEGQDDKITDILDLSLKYLFANYNIAGVITRFGECDGVDVKSLFKSKLVIKTPKQMRFYIKQLLPLFESSDKTWIFRTWSLGAYKVGDLMWNEKTFRKVFSGIKSDNFVISMKYGNGDFFRNLELNPLLLLKNWNFIVELQAKREYDGFGDLPYYTGWDYSYYINQLKNQPNLVGCSVWCMTGGWKKSSRITYFENSSPWVELNTLSTVGLFNGKSPDDSVVDYFGDKRMIEFLRMYNDFSLRIMYPTAKPNKYFRKVKIPPLTWLFWGNVSINSLILSYQKYMSGTDHGVTTKGLSELFELGKGCKVTNIDYIYDTLSVLLVCRNFIDKGGDVAELRASIDRYTTKYPDKLSFNVSQGAKPSRKLGVLLRLALRNKEKYRLVDRLLLNRLVLVLAIKSYMGLNRKKLPKFVDSQAMPIDTFLK
jgi:hypothetical protein